MATKGKLKFNPEERRKMLLESSKRDIDEKIKFGILVKNPTRKFSVDERVQFGAHNESYVREIHEDGLYYLIEAIAVQRDRNTPPSNEFHYAEWYELYQYNKFNSVILHEKPKYRITQANCGIQSLLHMVYHSGVDFDVDYQRDHVWTLADKEALIDSIFNNIEIGKFVFVQRDFGFVGKLFEIIDGKQRLTALREFYEDRFKYKGFYFSQLHPSDKNAFETHPVTYGYLTNPTREAILDTFIKLNTTGRPMENKDIENAKKLLKNINN
jgi:hypothetical protein